MNRYQFTMWSDQGYAPVASTVEANSQLDFASNTIYRQKAIAQICAKRGWTRKELISFGYKKYKVRRAPEPQVKPQGSINL